MHAKKKKITSLFVTITSKNRLAAHAEKTLNCICSTEKKKSEAKNILDPPPMFVNIYHDKMSKSEHALESSPLGFGSSRTDPSRA